jgi:hypothetical protein
MIEGGKGGARTQTGLEFEGRVNLKEVFSNLEGYRVCVNDLYYEGKLVARFYQKYNLYTGLLMLHRINWAERISKRWLPDEAIFVLSNKTLYIIEMKFQKVSGSVDEKLQTCDFKKKVYQKLLSGTGIKVEYCYILNDWFKQKQYKDTLDYAESSGCRYFFKELPFDYLGLPKPKATPQK